MADAKNIRDRHEVLARFLIRMRVDQDIANRDAECIEHQLDPEILQKLEVFIGSLRDRGSMNLR